MAQTLSPFFRSPWTDLTGGLVSHQLFGRCANMEMDMMDCLEEYGLDRGMRKCKDLIEEFKECHTLTLQFKRFYAIRAERERQIAEGKLKGECRYVTPKAVFTLDADSHSAPMCERDTVIDVHSVDSFTHWGGVLIGINAKTA